MDYYIHAGALFLIIINIAVSIFCLKRDDLSRFQKLSQASIVWIVPLFGAILVYGVVWTFRLKFSIISVEH